MSEILVIPEKYHSSLQVNKFDFNELVTKIAKTRDQLRIMESEINLLVHKQMAFIRQNVEEIGPRGFTVNLEKMEIIIEDNTMYHTHS